MAATAAVNVTQLVATVTAQQAELFALQNAVKYLTRVVRDQEVEASRSLLGADFYTVIALLVPLLVAAYQLVPDPTGDQDHTEQSELGVYHEWRMAAATLFGYGVLVIGIVLQQLQSGWGGVDLWWVVALMLAPWAPLAGQVWRTLTAFWRVRFMMRSRGCRNRLTAVMREYLCVGNPYLAPSIMAARHRSVELLPRLWVPRWVVPNVAEEKDEVLNTVRKALNARAKKRDILLDASRASAAAYAWAMRVNFLDPLARMWSNHGANIPPTRSRSLRGICDVRSFCARHAVGETVMLSPFHLPPAKTAGDTARAAAGVEVKLDSGKVRRSLSSKEETVLLDAIDVVQPGGTLSKTRVEQLCRCCERCVMALRAAVELFTESSNCGHQGVNAGEWFKDFDLMPPRPSSYVLSVLRAAVLVDCRASPIDGQQPGDADAEDGMARPETDRVLTLLFFVARSLLGRSGRLEPLRAHITVRYHSAAWWDSFWVALRDRLSRRVVPASGWLPTEDGAMDDIMQSAVRDTAAGEVRRLLQVLHEPEALSGLPAAAASDPEDNVSG
eukprot:contig_38432_g8976